MISGPIGTNIAIPIRLELAGVGVTGLVGGGAAGNVNVKIADAASPDWDPLTVSTHFTLNELSEGDYTLTILAAKITLPGVMRIKVWDNNSEATFETKQYVVNIMSIIDSVLGERVYFTGDAAGSGTLAPYGSAAKPVNDLNDAITIANSHDVKEIAVGLRNSGGETLSVAGSGLNFIGKNEAYDYLHNNPIILGVTAYGAIFQHLPVAWTATGVFVAGTVFRDCILRGISSPTTTEGFRDCLAESCIFLGTTQVYATDLTVIQDSVFQEAELDIYGAAGQTMTIANCQGRLNISRLENATILLLNFNGILTLGADCTSGKIIVTGRGAVIDNSAGTEVDVSAFVESYGVDYQNGLLGAPMFVDQDATSGQETGRDWTNAFLTIGDAVAAVNAAGKASIIYVMGNASAYSETGLVIPDRCFLVGVYNDAFVEVRGSLTTESYVMKLGDHAVVERIRFGCTTSDPTKPVVEMSSGARLLDSSFGGIAAGQDFLVKMDNLVEAVIKRTELSGSGNAKNAIRMTGAFNCTIEDNTFLSLTEDHITTNSGSALAVIQKNAFLDVQSGFHAVVTGLSFHRIVWNAYNGDGNFIEESAGGSNPNIVQGNEAGLTEERMKEIIYNRSVASRHANNKPKTIQIGPAGADGVVTTTLDPSGNMQTETLS